MIQHKNDTDENRYQINIMGDDYVIRGSGSRENMESIASYVENSIQGILTQNPKLNKVQVAVLSAFKIADELHKLREDYQYLEQLLNEVK